MKKYLLVATFSLFCAHALGETIFDRTITRIGAQGTTVYFSISPAPSTLCKYALLYIMDTNSPGSQLKAAIALSAYMDQVKLTRGDYSQQPDEICKVDLVER